MAEWVTDFPHQVNALKHRIGNGGEGKEDDGRSAKHQQVPGEIPAVTEDEPQNRGSQCRHAEGTGMAISILNLMVSRILYMTSVRFFWARERTILGIMEVPREEATATGTLESRRYLPP